MKVLHIITGLARGGAENMLYRLLSMSDRSQVDPVVLSLMEGGVYSERIKSLGIPILELRMSPGLPNPLAYLRLKRLVKRSSPDIVHAWMYHGALAALLAERSRPVVIAIHHSLHDIAREKAMTRAIIIGLKRMSSRAARITYCSEASRRQHEALGYPDELSIVIPNGFDCHLLRPDASSRVAVRMELGVHPMAFVVGHLGRFHEVKDHRNLLEAFAGLAKMHPTARLIMAGKEIDAENEMLSREISKLGIVDNVLRIGERDDVPRLMSAFDVLANSSFSEAFPNVLGEAMACGVPCVATDVGDSRHIIGNTGICVPPKSPEALTEALIQIASMNLADRSSLGLRARARIVEKFSLAKIVADYTDLYEAVWNESMA